MVYARTTLIVALIISWNAMIAGRPLSTAGPRRLQVWIPSLAAAGGSAQAQPPPAPSAAPPLQGATTTSSSSAAAAPPPPPPATILNLPPGLMPRQPSSSSIGWGFGGGWTKAQPTTGSNWFWSSFPSPFSFQTSSSSRAASASAASASITSMAAAGDMDQLPHTTLETAATLEQAGLVAIAVNKGGQQQVARRDTVPTAAPAAASSTDASGSGQGGSGSLTTTQSQGGDLKAQAAAGGAASAGSGNEPAGGFFAQASTRTPAYSQGAEGQQQQRQPKRALLHRRL